MGRRTVISLALLVCGLLLAAPDVARAYTTLPNGVNPIVSYTEPNTNTDNTTLTNLKETHIYWKLGAGAEQTVIVPASSPTGGQSITRSNILVPVLACQVGTLAVQVTALNTANQESARSGVVTLAIDRKSECVPNVPSTLTVQ